ncbi:MAG TPA: alanine racemase [Thermoanaerobaculia bacterium]|jgi:alanine racemase
MSGAAERFRPTWAEVDTGAFSRNIDAIVGRLPERARLVAVLKANAYGHGAVELARLCDPGRVAMIAVALLEEALQLRRAGITLPIIVFGPVGERGIVAAGDNDITLGVPGPEELAIACEVARSRDVHVHLKLDSGMGRMGVTETELPAVVEKIRATPRLHVDGVYTHFASADDDPEFTQEQIERFDRMRAAIDAPLQHFANSAATLRGLVRPGDLARVGIALYDGVMRWRTEIARLKTLPPGHAIGYGTTFHTTRESRIATLPVGYADGFNRLQSNNGTVLVRGRRAPIVGRVSMDLVTIDVTDIQGAAAGDEVVLLGDGITADEIAARIDTISYEVFCSISARVPRVYR